MPCGSLDLRKYELTKIMARSIVTMQDDITDEKLRYISQG